MKKVKKQKAPFEVGDLVTTEFGHETKDVVRQITKIIANANCSSGFIAWADGGEPCPTCKRAHAKPTPASGIDAAWFVKVVKE